MPLKFYAYVDEAGDEGFGKLRSPTKSGQSRWLGLGAALVTEENDRFMPVWRDEIVALFDKKKNRRDLHFRYLNHNQRVAACNTLREKPVGICVIASNKETILDSEEVDVFKRKQHLYNYLVRFLMERLTAACASKAKIQNDTASLFVTFSRRAGTDYQQMRAYFELMRDGREVLKPVRTINWTVFDPANLRVENHAVRAGLQIADVVTSATCCGLEPNEYGNVESRYALSLKKRYLMERSRILNCGLTLIPPIGRCPLSDEQAAFVSQLNSR
ncbi:MULTISPECIES: DUF3800 domain-containing protein [unclassified Mesorhizobium]|uniref:DUF3800 domain-containing protein n=1 Tax=unclassified Mesorhizobium TaxID=325217 RepID=UPI001CCFA8CC|nr:MULTISPECIES: DUF3800 domain-containing protein [unclassified Mesorhizobium]MBZ9737978.1 DUF3800 domain-containing protein [Mesorhizobium sp. CO1-1-4]MBZ9801835.1 DUF3800 domain-containing protein [Mesorhizobium sp. ES1-6]